MASVKVLYDGARHSTASLTAELAEMAKWGISKKDALNFQKSLSAEIASMDEYTARNFVPNFARLLGVINTGIAEDAPGKATFASLSSASAYRLRMQGDVGDPGEVMGDKVLYDGVVQSTASLVADLSEKVRWGITEREANDFSARVMDEIGCMDDYYTADFAEHFGRFVGLIAAGMPEGPARSIIAGLPQAMTEQVRALAQADSE